MEEIENRMFPLPQPDQSQKRLSNLPEFQRGIHAMLAKKNLCLLISIGCLTLLSSASAAELRGRLNGGAGATVEVTCSN